MQHATFNMGFPPRRRPFLPYRVHLSAHAAHGTTVQQLSGQLRRKSRGLRDLSRSPVQLRRQVVYHGPSKILHRMEDRHDCISGRSHLKCDATFFADRGNIRSNDRLTSSLIPALGTHLRKRSSAPRYLEASLRVLCVNWRICSSRFPIENRSLRRPRGVLVQKLGEVVRPVVTEY